MQMNRRILIADDDVQILEYYRTLFGEEAAKDDSSLPEDDRFFQVQTFRDGSLLLDVFKSEYSLGKRIPLCVLDVRMEYMDGIQTAEALRSTDSEVVIIVITSQADIAPADLIRNLKRDFYFLRKPVRGEELLAQVNSLLNNWNHQQALKRAYQQVNQTQRQLQTILNHSPAITVQQDMDGRYQMVNRKFELVFRLSKDKVLNRTDMDIFPPSTAYVFTKNFREVVRQGKALEFEEQIPIKGMLRTFFSVRYPILDEAGNMTGVGCMSKDITERKQAAEALRKSEELYRLRIRDLGRALNATASLEEALIFCLEAAVRESGTDGGAVHLLEGDRYALACHTGLSEEVINIFPYVASNSPLMVLLRGGDPLYAGHREYLRVSKKLKMPEGFKFLAVLPIIYEYEIIAIMQLFSMNAEEIPLSARQAVETISTQMGSVVARLKAQQRLRESEERHRVITENSYDLIAELDESGRFVYANPQHEPVIGYLPKDLIGTGIYTYIHTEDLLGIKEKHQHVIQNIGESRRSTFRYRHRDDRWLWMETVIRAYRIASGSIRMVTATRDISRQKWIEEALQKGEETVRGRLKMASASSMLITPNGTILAIDPISANSIGKRPDELIEKSLFQFIPEDMGDMLKTRIAECMVSGEPIYFEETRDGIVYDRSIIPIPDRFDKTFQIAIYSRDITEQRKASKELFQTYRELQETKDMLVQSEKLAAVGQLASGVAHEILNPTNIISMRIQLLNMTGTLPEPIKQSLNICSQQLDRIVKITRDLNAFTRFNEKTKQMSNINEIIDHVMIFCVPQFKFENIDIEFDLQPDLPNIPVYRNQLEQVFLNILSNSIAELKTRETKKIRILSRFVSDENSIEIIITDTGGGIPEKDRYNIFNPFFTTKQPGQGTGLGLFISYNIIQEHDGKIWAQNNISGGASFFIRLPIQD